MIAIHFVALGFFLSLLLADLIVKFFDFEQFVLDLTAYNIVPDGYSQAAARAAMTIEVITFACLCFPVTRSVGLGSAAALLSAYALFIGINLLRGRSDIACGCGGSKALISWMMVGRNTAYGAILLGLAGRILPHDVPVLVTVTAISLGMGLHFLSLAWTKLALITTQIEADGPKGGFLP